MLAIEAPMCQHIKEFYFIILTSFLDRKRNCFLGGMLLQSFEKKTKRWKFVMPTIILNFLEMWLLRFQAKKLLRLSLLFMIYTKSPFNIILGTGKKSLYVKFSLSETYLFQTNSMSQCDILSTLVELVPNEQFINSHQLNTFGNCRKVAVVVEFALSGDPVYSFSNGMFIEDAL